MLINKLNVGDKVWARSVTQTEKLLSIVKGIELCNLPNNPCIGYFVQFISATDEFYDYYDPETDLIEQILLEDSLLERNDFVLNSTSKYGNCYCKTVPNKDGEVCIVYINLEYSAIHIDWADDVPIVAKKYSNFLDLNQLQHALVDADLDSKIMVESELF